MSPKSCFYFLPKFRWRRILVDLKPHSQMPLGPIATFPFPGGVIGKFFWKNSSASPDFAPRDGPPAQHVQNTSRFNFAAKNAHLEWRYNVDFFSEVLECFSVRNIQKNRWNCFGFWLISFRSRIFAGGTWKRRRTTFADFVKQIWKVFDTVIYG